MALPVMLALWITTCPRAYMSHAFYYSHTTYYHQSNWTPTGGAFWLWQSFSSTPFPALQKCQGSSEPDLSQAAGPILQAGVGHFPFWLFSLLPSACSLSTLLLCLHPALHGLQQFDVMASCCGWPGGPSALLVSWLLSAWAPFKEIKHFCQLSHVLTQLCEMRSPHYPFSGRRRSVCVVYFRPIL